MGGHLLGFGFKAKQRASGAYDVGRDGQWVKHSCARSERAKTTGGLKQSLVAKGGGKTAL